MNAEDGTPTQWPYSETLSELKAVDLDQLVGAARLGAIAFEDAPEMLTYIVDVVDDFSLEDRNSVSEKFLIQIADRLTRVREIVRSMLELSSGVSNAVDARNSLSSQLQTEVDWFRSNVPAQSVVAKIRREVSGQAELEELLELRNYADRLQADFQQLREQNATLAHEIGEQRPAVEAYRAASGVTGASDLAAHYEDDSTDHKDAWKLWGVVLVGALMATIAAAILLFKYVPVDDDASNSVIARNVFFEILVIGLLLYGVRLASLQFRVHRHLDAVAANKAAALSTFSRIVATSSEAEVRAAIATVLAQSVFESQNTGFIGTDSDGVTIVERVAAPLFQRSTS